MESIKKIAVIFILLIFAIGCKQNENLKFYPLQPFSIIKSDTGEPIYRTDYYLIKHFNEGDTNNISLIDSFVLNHLPQDYKAYSSYQMLFYKYDSDNMNENYQHNSKELIEWKGEFLLFEFRWDSGKFLYSTYKKDKKIETIFKPKW